MIKYYLHANGYRYIKALWDVGLLAPVSNGHYILGPRIVELDRQSRQSVPLYKAAGPSIKRLVADSGHSALLCAFFSGSVGGTVFQVHNLMLMHGHHHRRIVIAQPRRFRLRGTFP